MWKRMLALLICAILALGIWAEAEPRQIGSVEFVESEAEEEAIEEFACALSDDAEATHEVPLEAETGHEVIAEAQEPGENADLDEQQPAAEDGLNNAWGEAMSPAMEPSTLGEYGTPEAADGEPDAEGEPALLLSAEEVTLGVGEKYTLTAMLRRADGQETASTVQFSTSNKKYATVSAEGVVKAVKVGKVNIIATAANGVQAVCAIKVVSAPKSIKLNATKATLGFDRERRAFTSFQLTAKLPSKTASRITYAGYDAAIVSVDENGLIVAQGVGKTTVTAKTFNGKKATCVVTVLPGPESLNMEPEALTLMEKAEANVRATANSGTYADIRYASEDADILSVDAATGAMVAHRIGETRVTATAFNGVQAECAVKVVPGPEEIALSESERTLGVGDKFTLTAMPRRADGQETASTVQFSTSNKKYAKVSAEGVVKAVKAGKVNIFATAANGVQAVCAIKVVSAPKSVKLNKSQLTLEFDPAAEGPSSYQLEATPSKGSVSAITWNTDDPGIIDVDESGLITAVGFGTTNVWARTYNGKKAKCVVTVQLAQEVMDSYRATHPLIAIAHRGGKAYWPENTLEAFSHTEETGADMIELDVRTTKDGVQVVHHDESFKVGKVSYVITKRTYEELVSAKPSLCTLDEALALISKTGLGLELEMKKSANAAKCVEAVARWGMQDRLYYISFDKKLLTQVRKLDGRARLGWIFSGSIPKDLNATVQSLRLSLICPHWKLVTQKRLNKWHRMGLMVNVWVINSVEECQKYAEMNVDMITSDYPDYPVHAK